MIYTKPNNTQNIKSDEVQIMNYDVKAIDNSVATYENLSSEEDCVCDDTVADLAIITL